MHENTFSNPTYWEAVSGLPPAMRPALGQDMRCDIAVVGAGIVGLTAAYELARAGKKVIVLEATVAGQQVTARSTAKITAQHGLKYASLIRNFGEDNARLYAQANQNAIDYLESLILKKGIDCAFERTDAYVYTNDIELVSTLNDEAVAAGMLGLPASIETELSVSIPCKAALHYSDQAQFNPVQYLLGLAETVASMAQLFELTRVTKIEEDDTLQLIHTEAGHTVTARHVVVATHLPIVPEGKFYAKAYPFSHSVVAAPLPDEIQVPGMFLTGDEPSYSFRVDSTSGAPYLIAAGPEYATGDAQEQIVSFEKLEEFLRTNFGIRDFTHRWTNEDFRPMDGMPFVGPATGSTPHLHVATGFNAWGISNGVAAACIIADLILARQNPYADLFQASRLKPLAGGTEFVKESLKTAKEFVIGHLSGSSIDADAHVALGTGLVTRENGQHVARYRSMDGTLHERSAVCTHMGCVVDWNVVDCTWDCPCHGSRFAPDGTVLHGPATAPLPPLDPKAT